MLEPRWSCADGSVSAIFRFPKRCGGGRVSAPTARRGVTVVELDAKALRVVYLVRAGVDRGVGERGEET